MSLKTNIETAAAALSTSVDVRYGIEESFVRWADGGDEAIVLFWAIESAPTEKLQLKVRKNYSVSFWMMQNTTELLDDTFNDTRYNNLETLEALFDEFFERLDAELKNNLGRENLGDYTLSPIFNFADRNLDGWFSSPVSVPIYKTSYTC